LFYRNRANQTRTEMCQPIQQNEEISLVLMLALCSGRATYTFVLPGAK
jgi:hypothetical protein